MKFFLLISLINLINRGGDLFTHLSTAHKFKEDKFFFLKNIISKKKKEQNLYFAKFYLDFNICMIKELSLEI